MSIDWRPFVELVHEHESFVLTSHMRPDCDAIGSELALAHALRSLGKKAQIVNGDAVPPHIAFVDADREALVLGQDITAGELRPDVWVVVDTSAWGQLGPMAEVIRRSTARKVVIDHHVSADNLGAVAFKDPSAEAAGRLVLEAIDSLGVPVTRAMAVALFTAIATDTGWFRFASVGAATLKAASRLVEAGARPAETFAALYEQQSFARLRLQGRILINTRPEVGGRLLYSVVSAAELAESGAESTDTEDIINRLLSVAGVSVAILFVELGPSEIKVSLRSRSSVDVHRIAEQFGGGGHRAAAGVRYRGPLHEAVAAVLNALRAAISR
jgi:phosphoesterase RecJ-like protein